MPSISEASVTSKMAERGRTPHILKISKHFEPSRHQLEVITRTYIFSQSVNAMSTNLSLIRKQKVNYI